MKLSILDDPTLALIARFVVKDIDQLELSNETYLRHQLAEIKRYVSQFPEQEQEAVALAWIKEHAERYRDEWQKRKLSEVLPGQRCPDCPLTHDSSTSFCIIHRRWVGLLNEYVAGEINSERYIEETLRLLEQHKHNLHISAISSGM